MEKYGERIRDDSVWLTATPTQTALVLPFYATEAGHFYAEPEYEVKREFHDSFLILYTLSGCGVVNGGAPVALPRGAAVMIDCRRSHSYASSGGEWEFLWIHVKGSAAETFFSLLYPGGTPFAVTVNSPERMTALSEEIMACIGMGKTESAVRVSADIHGIMDILIGGSLRREGGRGAYVGYVEDAAELIRRRYRERLSIDDILSDVPLSKYYFIRVFSRIMGTTPYDYLMDQRINGAKILLRTTDMPVSDVAGECGFSDTSNFIMQFRKRTGQRPLEYRRYFL